MKRTVFVSVMAVFLCIAMSVVFLSGCGSGGAARIENPSEFFAQARENMQTVASFRMSGEVAAEFTGVPGMDSMAIDYDMIWEQKSDGKPLAKMDMSMEGPPSVDAQMYIVGDRVYMEMPGGMWVYQDVDLSSDLADISQGMGPQYVMEMLEMAESAEVVAEDDDTITYDLVLDLDKIMQAQGEELEKMKEQLEKEGISEEDIPLFMDYMKDILSGMELQMTVDKESGLATRFKIYMETDFDSLAAMFPEDESIPQGASMVMEGDFEISDYGKSFDIVLPEEAKDAIPVEEIEKLQET